MRRQLLKEERKHSFFLCCEVARSLGGRAFCSVSPARCAVSSLTCAERPVTQAPYLRTASSVRLKCRTSCRPRSSAVNSLGVGIQMRIHRPPRIKHEAAPLVVRAVGFLKVLEDAAFELVDMVQP